jgi:heme/copper-type cytochrome/quinol oxidase subunit 3
MSAHAEDRVVRPEEWPDEEIYGNATGGKIGMWVFLLSDALMFAGFLLAYAILRGGQAAYIAAEDVSVVYWRCNEAAIERGIDCVLEPDFGIPFTAALTFLLICSSVTMVFAYYACIEKNHKGMVKYLWLTAFGGFLFLGGQYYEYFGFGIPGHGLYPQGLIFGQSFFATTFYMVTSFHGAHVFSGVTYIVVMAIRAMMGKYDDGNQNHIEILGLFWHFVDLIWIIVFTFIYLIPSPGDHPSFPML